MVVTLAVAVPWLAAVETVTLVAVPPERLNVTALPVELKDTVLLTAPAIGAAGLTVTDAIPGGEVPLELVPVY
jgi:hypothetical protein